jgi:hypothetical protein
MKARTMDWFTVGTPELGEPVVRVNGRTGSIQFLTAGEERMPTEDELRAAWRRFARVVVGDRS